MIDCWRNDLPTHIPEALILFKIEYSHHISTMLHLLCHIALTLHLPTTRTLSIRMLSTIIHRNNHHSLSHPLMTKEMIAVVIHLYLSHRPVLLICITHLPLHPIHRLILYSNNRVQLCLRNIKHHQVQPLLKSINHNILHKALHHLIKVLCMLRATSPLLKVQLHLKKTIIHLKRPKRTPIFLQLTLLMLHLMSINIPHKVTCRPLTCKRALDTHLSHTMRRRNSKHHHRSSSNNNQIWCLLNNNTDHHHSKQRHNIGMGIHNNRMLNSMRAICITYLVLLHSNDSNLS